MATVGSAAKRRGSFSGGGVQPLKNLTAATSSESTSSSTTTLPKVGPQSSGISGSTAASSPPKQADDEADLSPRDRTQRTTRRRSMSDLARTKQAEYANMVDKMGIKPKSNRALVDDSSEVGIIGSLALDTLKAINDEMSGSSQAAAPSSSAGPALPSPRTLPPISSPTKSGQIAASHPTSQADKQKRDFYSKVSSIDGNEDLESPTSRFVAKTSQLNIIPDAIISRVIASVERDGSVSLPSSSIGDDLAVALSHSVSVMFVQSVDISNNHLSDKGICALVSCLDAHLCHSLDVSKLNPKKKSIDTICNLVAETSSLSALIMEDCKVDDGSMRALCDALRVNMCQLTGRPLHICTIRRLNLSHNKIGDAGAVVLASAIEGNASLAEVDLAYNQIRGKGGCALAAVLGETRISQLDLGFNALGSGDGTEGRFADAIGACLSSNVELLHLSLSFNGLSPKDCEVLGENLKTNHALMGLHLEGNSPGSTIDAHGYVLGGVGGQPATGRASPQNLGERRMSPDAILAVDKTPHHTVNRTFSRILPWANPRLSKNETGVTWRRGDGSCWLCGRWNETRFTFDPDTAVGGRSAGGGEKRFCGTMKSVSLATNFDEWSTETMTRCSDGTFEIYRMVPPGKIGYAFKVVEEGKEPLLMYAAKDQPQIDAALTQFDGGGNVSWGGEAKIVNVMTVAKRSEESDEIIRLLPRTKSDAPVAAPKHKPKKNEWTLKNSVFAAYKYDSKKILDQAFASDVGNVKSAKGSTMKKHEEAEQLRFKAVLQEHFEYFKQHFKHYGASYTNEIFSVGVNAFNQFVTDIKVLDESGGGGGGFTRAETDIIFVSACGTGNKTLNRFQFLDAICQIALCRFIKFGDVKLPSEALQRLSKEHILPHAEKDEQFLTFRKSYLHNQNCDAIFSDRKDQLLRVFKGWSGRFDLPGEAKTMSMTEYLELVDFLELAVGPSGAALSERSVTLAFIRSKETSVDETSSNSKHKKLSFVEFLEVLARLAYDLGSGKFSDEAAAGVAQLLKETVTGVEITLGQFCAALEVLLSKACKGIE